MFKYVKRYILFPLQLREKKQSTIYPSFDQDFSLSDKEYSPGTEQYFSNFLSNIFCCPLVPCSYVLLPNMFLSSAQFLLSPVLCSVFSYPKVFKPPLKYCAISPTQYSFILLTSLYRFSSMPFPISCHIQYIYEV
jgi:hypothetical protein